jgi:hypothetical protein
MGTIGSRAAGALLALLISGAAALAGPDDELRSQSTPDLEVRSTDPLDGARDVPVDGWMRVRFSKPLPPLVVERQWIRIVVVPTREFGAFIESHERDVEPARFRQRFPAPTYEADRVSYRPGQPLRPDTDYTVMLFTFPMDLLGVDFSADNGQEAMRRMGQWKRYEKFRHRWTFRTAPAGAPAAASSVGAHPKLPPSSAPWSAPEDVARARRPLESLAVHGDATGRLGALWWTEGFPWSTSSARGGPWTPPQPVLQDIDLAERGVVTASPAGYAVAATRPTPMLWTPGAGWTALPPLPGPAEGVRCSVDDVGTVVAWWTGGSGPSFVRIRRGGAWEALPAPPGSPLVVLQGGRGRLLVVAASEGHAEVETHVLEANASWAQLGPSGAPTRSVVAAEAANDAVLAYVATEGDRRRVTARRLVGWKTWEEPVVLGDCDAAEGSVPFVRYDAQGRALAAWSGKPADGSDAPTACWSVFIPGTGWKKGPPIAGVPKGAHLRDVVLGRAGAGGALFAPEEGTGGAATCVRFDFGRGWQERLDLPAAARDVRLAADDDGTLSALWHEGTREGRGVVRCARSVAHAAAAAAPR